MGKVFSNAVFRWREIVVVVELRQQHDKSFFDETYDSFSLAQNNPLSGDREQEWSSESAKTTIYFFDLI